MARKSSKLELSVLESVTEDLRLPSLMLTPPRLHGHTYRFKIVLPLLSQTGEEVFTPKQVAVLHDLLNQRCGGSLASASATNPAWYGSYQPEAQAESVKDYHTVLYAYTRQIDAADRFFQLLKTILKKAGGQDEILIERAAVWLVEAAPLPRDRGAQANPGSLH